MRVFIGFSYDGSKYSGYQKQKNKKTVQGVMEDVLKQISGGDTISIIASGRTDAGVHAIHQRAHFDFTKDIPLNKLKKAINSLLPDDIYVSTITKVDDKFHARYSAKAKEYIYRINMGTYNPIEKDYVYQYNKKLDIPEVERALKYVEGTHDFKSFVKLEKDNSDCVRTIIQTNLVRDVKNVNMITISIFGTGFKRYMVRNIVGTLIEIGEGKRKSEEMIDILNKKDRKAAGICVPACGLYLKDVYY